MENARINALRPSQPPEPDAQLRWLIERQTEAMVRLSAATEQLTVAVNELRQAVVVLTARGGP